MSERRDEWRWADGEGATFPTDKWELVTLLSTGRVPYYTLVWRPGWAEWLPACRVTELLDAVGEHREPPVQPLRKPGLDEPPPPPLHKHRAYAARTGSRDAAEPESDAPVLRQQVGSGVAPPTESDLGRRPMPTLMDEPLPRNGNTLRPPAAVPPPPRGMPRGMTPYPGTLAAAPGAARVAAADAAQSATTLPDTSAPPPAAPAAAAPASPMPAQARAEALTWRVTPLAAVALALLAGAVGVGLAVVFVGLRRVERDPAQAGRASRVEALAAGPSASARVPEPLPECRLLRTARRIAASVDGRVPPYLYTLAHGRGVAVGYATEATDGAGLVLDIDSLAPRPGLTFSDPGSELVAGVVPLGEGAGVRFEVDREGGALASAHTVAAGLVIGIADGKVARARAKSVEPLWDLGGAEAITPPRTATIRDGRHAVAVRVGGLTGQIRVGWLDNAGARASDLAAVVAEAQVGTPGLAVSPRELLVTFASRPDQDAKWGVSVARATAPELPTRAVPFVVPPGGPGIETIAPSATGLPDGRWVLQWTEGASGNRQVRVQTLAPDLTPLGAAITLSAAEDNAGQGVVHAAGDRVLAVFLVARGESRQLWAAALECALP